jgi:hypothetical protein
MNLETNKIYTFKLTTGEEIVARVVDPTMNDSFVMIEHPILTVLSPQGLQMMPGLFSADLQQRMQLNISSCVCVAETRDDVRNSWIEATSGIRTVSKQIITG